MRNGQERETALHCTTLHYTALHCTRLRYTSLHYTTHYTLHTTHYTLHTTHYTQHTTHNTQHTTHNTQHTTHNTQHTTHNTQHTTTTTTQHNTIWGGSVLTGEEPPPHSGELNHALTQAGVPTQFQLSRPMSSGHHISMEHRLWRKHQQLNTHSDASNEIHLKRERGERENMKKLKKKKEKEPTNKKRREQKKTKEGKKRTPVKHEECEIFEYIFSFFFGLTREILDDLQGLPLWFKNPTKHRTTLHYTLHTTHYTLHTTHYTLHTTLCTLHSALCTLHSALCTPHTTHHTPHTAHHTLHSTALHSTPPLCLRRGRE